MATEPMPSTNGRPVFRIGTFNDEQRAQYFMNEKSADGWQLISIQAVPRKFLDTDTASTPQLYFVVTMQRDQP